MQNKNNSQRGYTIIETMIAVSLFVIVIMAGMGALLNANLLHQKSRDMRSIMDNLSFIMEDMSRNLRTGYNYHCIDDGVLTEIVPHSCPYGEGISFQSSSTGQWVYYVGNTVDGQRGIFRIVDGETVQLTPDEINIDLDSGFSVRGAEPYLGNCVAPSDCEQPFVTIKLVGEITFKDVVTPFSLQTSISQRLIDI